MVSVLTVLFHRSFDDRSLLMLRGKLVLLVACCWFGSLLPTYGQISPTFVLKGRVTDSDGQPIVGATVAVQGGGMASSDENGLVTLTLSRLRPFTITHVNFQPLSVNPSTADSAYHWVLQPSPRLLDEVSLTASATPMQLRQIASSVSILRQDSPELRQIQTIDEALAYVPGVSVDRSRGLTTTGTHTGITMRGTGSANRTLILKDGVPINDSYTGGVSEWNSLATNSIARVEVVRGPGSSLYGSNSMGGTINLVTQQPGERPTVGAGIRYGSMNTFQADAKVGGRLGKRWGAIAFAEYKTTDGYAYMADSLWNSYFQKPRMALLNVNAKLAYDLGNGSKLTAIADYNTQHPESGTSTIYDEHTMTGNYQLRYTGGSDRFIPEIIAYYNVQNRSTEAIQWNAESQRFDNRNYHTRIPLDTYGLIAKVSQQWRNHSVTLGADLRFTEIVSRKYYYTVDGSQDFTGRQDFISFFLNDDFRITDALHVNAGLRYDHWANRQGTFFDSQSSEDIYIDYDDASSDILTPKVGLTFDVLSNLRLRSVYATGFRAPSAYYMYNSAPLGSSFRLGNPNLKPERMRYSVDFGIDFQWTDRLEVSATTYASRYGDFLAALLIDAEQVPDYFDAGGLPVRQYINIGDVALWGVEAFARYRLTHTLSAQASYFHNRSRIKRYETNPEYEGNAMDDNPAHSASATLVFDHPRWFHLSVWGRHTGKRFGDLENTSERQLDAVTLADIKLAKTFGPIGVSLTVNNLFDTRYYGSYTSPTSYYFAPGRLFFTGVSYQL